MIARLSAEVLMGNRDITGHLTTDEGRAFFRSLSSERIGPIEKASRLREQAARFGISSCPFADLWEGHLQ